MPALVLAQILKKLVINYKNLLNYHFYLFLYSGGNNDIMVRYSPHNIKFMGLSLAIPANIGEEENNQLS